MIPLRDTAPQRHLPFMNALLVAACAAAFVWEMAAGPQIQELIHTYALIPTRFLTVGGRDGFLSLAVWEPLWTSMFLHGSLMHVASNLLFLWIFGGPVEDRLGHLGYPLFYLAGGSVAGLAHIAANPQSGIPTVGASGAIAAVMGAYCVIHPGARIVSVIPPFFWFTFQVPALIYLLFWFTMQVYMGNAALNEDPAQIGVAWWAHAGGFAFGVLAILFLGADKSREK
jgi:membrane associated rhomboid family serine protease